MRQHSSKHKVSNQDSRLCQVTVGLHKRLLQRRCNSSHQHRDKRSRLMLQELFQRLRRS